MRNLHDRCQTVETSLMGHDDGRYNCYKVKTGMQSSRTLDMASSSSWKGRSLSLLPSSIAPAESILLRARLVVVPAFHLKTLADQPRFCETCTSIVSIRRDLDRGGLLAVLVPGER